MSAPTKVSERRPSYVLMTAAYNEEAFIETAIRCVLAQTVRPRIWVIVSDGSTDRTDEIVLRYAAVHSFIRFLRLDRAAGRSFGAKVRALHRGAELLAGEDFHFIGNLDADVGLDPTYFEELILNLQRNPKLGLVAGYVYEQQNGEFRPRTANRIDSVPHAAQLLRRACYEDIGGYRALKYGGEDWYAQTSARMAGWKAFALPGLRICHYRHTGRGTNILRDRFRLGRLDHSFGSLPVFELIKCAIRSTEYPFIIGALFRFAGFCWSYASGEPRLVPPDLVAFLRREQTGKLSGLMRFPERMGTMRAPLS